MFGRGTDELRGALLGLARSTRSTKECRHDGKFASSKYCGHIRHHLGKLGCEGTHKNPDKWIMKVSTGRPRKNWKENYWIRLDEAA
jgi:hypothetical protein